LWLLENLTAGDTLAYRGCRRRTAGGSNPFATLRGGGGTKGSVEKPRRGGVGRGVGAVCFSLPPMATGLWRGCGFRPRQSPGAFRSKKHPARPIFAGFFLFVAPLKKQLYGSFLEVAGEPGQGGAAGRLVGLAPPFLCHLMLFVVLTLGFCSFWSKRIVSYIETKPSGPCTAGGSIMQGLAGHRTRHFGLKGPFFGATSKCFCSAGGGWGAAALVGPCFAVSLRVWNRPSAGSSRALRGLPCGGGKTFNGIRRLETFVWPIFASLTPEQNRAKPPQSGGPKGMPASLAGRGLASNFPACPSRGPFGGNPWPGGASLVGAHRDLKVRLKIESLIIFPTLGRVFLRRQPIKPAAFFNNKKWRVSNHCRWGEKKFVRGRGDGAAAAPRVVLIPGGLRRGGPRCGAGGGGTPPGRCMLGLSFLNGGKTIPGKSAQFKSEEKEKKKQLRGMGKQTAVRGATGMVSGFVRERAGKLRDGRAKNGGGGGKAKRDLRSNGVD